MKHTLLLAITLLLAEQIIGQSLCFDPASDNRFQCNQWPRDVVSGDFDEDGHLDVVTGNNGNGGDFLQGNGDGTFDTAIAIPGEGGDEIESADFNNDGHLDIVRLTWDTGLVMVNLGNGDGTFQDGIVIMSGVSSDMNTEIALGHYDQNGFIDIAVNDPQNDQIKLIGNMDGSTFTISPVSISTSDNPVNVSAGDLNNDGRADLVVAYAQITQIDFFYNTGFSYTVVSYDIDATVGNDLMEIEFMEINNDFNIDVVAHGLTTSAVFMNNGDDTMTQSSIFIGSYAYGSISGDWNNDGYADLGIANNTSGGVSIIMNGSGTFIPGVSYFSASEQAVELCSGDFDEDGNEDIVTANDNGGTISFLHGHGDGRFGSLSLLTGNGGNGMAAADFDVDGDLDLVSMNTYFSAFGINLNNGDGTFTETVYMSALGQCHQVAVGDFDEDDHLDIVTHSSEGYMIYGGNGDGTFTYMTTAASSSLGSGGTRRLLVDDFNNDGHDDIAGTFATTDELSVVYGDGSGGFSSTLQMVSAGYPRYMASGDVNGDGRADIVVSGNTMNEAWVYISTAGNNFNTPQVLATGNSPEGVTFLHANADAYLDLAVQSPNGLNLRIYEGSANGTFSNPHDIVLPANSNASDLTHGDMNNDGIDDLVSAFYSSHNAAIMFGSGNFEFQPAILFGTDQNPVQVITGHFNTDTALDMAVLNSGTNNMIVILNNSAFITANGPTSFCEGQTVTLTASSGYSYEWSNGATTQSIVVDTEGDYYCIIGNQAGTCDLLTSTVPVNIEEMVTVTWTFPIEAFCLNSDPYVLGGGQPLGGEYSGIGVTNGVFDPAVAGIGDHELTYTYASSANCFDGTTTATVTVVDSLVVSFDLPLDTVCLNMQLTLEGGSPAGGDYMINGSEYSSIATSDYGPGSVEILYMYAVSQNCQGSEYATLIIDDCIGIEELVPSQVSVYPTIVTDQLYISGNQISSVVVTDAGGRVVKSESPLRSSWMDFSDETAGVYFVQVKSEGKISTFRIVKY